MPIDHQELLHLADRLATGPDEVSWRSSISRAYYSAFHAVLPICDILPATCDEARLKGYVTHAEAWKRIREWKPTGDAACLQRLRKSAGVAWRQLDSARAAREEADYHLDDTITLELAKNQLIRVRDVRRFAAQVEAELARHSSAA